MNRPIYLALDFKNWQETELFLVKYQLDQVAVKVGMELFYREGPDVVKRLRDRGHEVFLDIKLHDIPTTIYKAMKNIAKLDVALTNVHGLGGGEMIQAAKAGLLDGANGSNIPDLLAVTLLTSIQEEVLKQELKIQSSVEETVVHLAKLAQDNGADGVVCSAHEVKALKAVCGDQFLAVTPGIRLLNSHSNDQKRVATPSLAKRNGADALVIGRSITLADHPKKAYLTAKEEWNA
ncbi:orotidine-5'-phosphate decarboxylase [Amphibacillus sp. MSJ-3]|uniref:orotidine-5'-phosphate decarboxylase n=1 Tax=Amphibacillus sp. MSJ-3 TaxID=2841505 RepID=UPI001C0EEA6F|nr:orotidine-5'-phosphate decarboxylase [Amphibacillus sp. MSJ-3]MBU5594617.1 orotidine-5'-phosphate decarboxylase [Amphibacillus sp. MSJ-3]